MKFTLYDKEFDSDNVAKINYEEKPGTDTLTIKLLDGSIIEKTVSGEERKNLKEFKEKLFNTIGGA